jgi:hypothetical protein
MPLFIAFHEIGSSIFLRLKSLGFAGMPCVRRAVLAPFTRIRSLGASTSSSLHNMIIRPASTLIHSHSEYLVVIHNRNTLEGDR